MLAQAASPSYFRLLSTAICMAAPLLGPARPTYATELEALQSYNVKLDETSVSGISSGAFMAVQFGVAHASIITGVGATAGGPYFCASDEVPSLRGSIGNVIARCMQGDPVYPKRSITKGRLDRLVKTTDRWARSGRIDATSHLEKQRIWLFHGYNDGIVKAAVSSALYDYYTHYVDPSQIFYKDNLRAGHAQITDDCSQGQTVCNLCEQTGRNFLNQCRDDAAGSASYDAVGSMLQHFYGTLQPKKTSHEASGKMRRFSQREFALDATGVAAPIRIAMADEGFVYVPDGCDEREPCRVHVAFHGCLQSADKIGNAFYEHAGYNQWADSNHLIVLYPQIQATLLPVLLPTNGQGCWDWWGYNDIFTSKGRYATKQGLQIAAVRRMLDRLAEQHSAATRLDAPRGEFGAPTGLVVGDFTHRQVELRWDPVDGAIGYNVYRNPVAGGPLGQAQRINARPVATTSATFVDTKVEAGKQYFYAVRALSPSREESANSAEVEVLTATTPPPCDPYFSLQRNEAVTKSNQPTRSTCQ